MLGRRWLSAHVNVTKLGCQLIRGVSGQTAAPKRLRQVMILSREFTA